MSIFSINPNITQAETLSSKFYPDEKYFHDSKEKIFAKAWHVLGHESEFSGLSPATILPGFLDEPILLVRANNSISGLSNVCTHRGKILVEEICEANLIRCGYHGRRFSLDGKFLSMPEFDGVENFPCESDDLNRVESAEKDGFIFASVNPLTSFNDHVCDAYSAFHNFETNGMKFESKREYVVDAHWALYCENYLEGFHIPYVHQALNAVVDYGTYTTDTFRFSSLQTGLDDAGQVAARYLFVFPNLMLNYYPWGVSVNVVRPVSPSKTVVEFYKYVRDSSLIEQGAGADLHGVEMEDEAVVESVQKGIRSRFYTHGRYSPTREQGTHHFHRLIAEFMG